MSSNIHVQIIFRILNDSFPLLSWITKDTKGSLQILHIFSVECCHWRLQVEVKEARQLHEEHGWWGLLLVLRKEVNRKRLCRGCLTIESI